jgi:hypothetical protein
LRLIVVIQGFGCVTKANNNESWFAPLFRIVGYALLALSLFDIIDVFVPAFFTNPAWEFQTARNLVERVPVPLLGAVLVFAGEKSIKIFKFLSWACLLAGVLFFLLVPLAISSGIRLDTQSAQEINNKVTQQDNQLQQLQGLLNKASTPAEIQSVLTRLNPQAGAVPTQNADQLKTQLLAKIADGEKQLKAQAANKRASDQRLLLKNTVKSVLGALVSGAIFVTLWRQTNQALKANRQRA